jgi:hypothetical protein
VLQPGLPDGFISNQKSNFWFILEGRKLEKCLYLMAIWNILQTFWIIYDHFGTFCVHLVHFSPFWYHAPRNTWQPWLQPKRCINRLIWSGRGSSVTNCTPR